MTTLLKEYDIGEELRSQITFQRKNAQDTYDLADPSVVVFKYKAPGGTITTLTYGVDGSLSRVGTGVYRCSFIGSAAGTWKYRWQATGTLVSARERRVNFKPTAF